MRAWDAERLARSTALREFPPAPPSAWKARRARAAPAASPPLPLSRPLEPPPDDVLDACGPDSPRAGESPPAWPVRDDTEQDDATRANEAAVAARPAKTYRCARWPFLKMGMHVAFQRGVFVTDDPALQELIESRPESGVHIVAGDA